MKAEKMLKIAADSWKMPGWNDTLSMVVDSAMPKTGLRALSDEDLQLVAGGAEVSDDLKREIMNKLQHTKYEL